MRGWVTSLGNLLNESARNKLMQLKGEMEVSAYTLLKKVVTVAQQCVGIGIIA